jgi:hypothetical protein
LGLGDHVKAAVSLANESTERGIPVDELAKQPGLDGNDRSVTPEAVAIARKLQEGPEQAALAFKRMPMMRTSRLVREGETPLERPTRRKHSTRHSRNTRVASTLATRR